MICFLSSYAALTFLLYYLGIMLAGRNPYFHPEQVRSEQAARVNVCNSSTVFYRYTSLDLLVATYLTVEHYSDVCWRWGFADLTRARLLIQTIWERSEI
jgi:hypothetical protein